MKKCDYRIVLKENGLGEKTYYIQQCFKLFWFIPIWLYCKEDINYEDNCKVEFKYLYQAEIWVEESIESFEKYVKSKQIKKSIIEL